MLGPRTGRENIHTLVRPRRALAKQGGVLGTSMGGRPAALGTCPSTLGTYLTTVGASPGYHHLCTYPTGTPPVFAGHGWNHFKEVHHYGGILSAARPTKSCIRIRWPSAG